MLELPNTELQTAQGLLDLGAQIIDETTTGNLTPDQAQKLFSLIKTQGEMIAINDLDHRLKAMENTLKQRIV